MEKFTASEREEIMQGWFEVESDLTQDQYCEVVAARTGRSLAARTLRTWLRGAGTVVGLGNDRLRTAHAALVRAQAEIARALAGPDHGHEPEATASTATTTAAVVTKSGSPTSAESAASSSPGACAGTRKTTFNWNE